MCYNSLTQGKRKKSAPAGAICFTKQIKNIYKEKKLYLEEPQK